MNKIPKCLLSDKFKCIVFNAHLSVFTGNLVIVIHPLTVDVVVILTSGPGRIFISIVNRAAHRGGQLGHFAPGPSLKGAPGGPMKGTLNTCLKDRYTLIEQSDLNILIEQSQYSSEEQCSKLIDKEMWLVMGSYCHCQQVVTFFFFLSSTYNLGEGPHFNSLPWAP